MNFQLLPVERVDLEVRENKNMNSKPKFIVLEGGEGSGKSTLLSVLKEEFGDTIFTTREPGGSPYAEVIRDAALKNPLAKGTPAETTLCLMFAARFDNTERAIMPVLNSGKSVVADRFDASSYTYQVFAQSGGGLSEIFWKLRDRLSVKPDMYIFADVDPKEGMRRAQKRNSKNGGGKQYDHFDDRELEFHQKVREGYLDFFKHVPHTIIDANKPLDEVKRDFLEKMRDVLRG